MQKNSQKAQKMRHLFLLLTLPGSNWLKLYILTDKRDIQVVMVLNMLGRLINHVYLALGRRETKSAKDYVLGSSIDLSQFDWSDIANFDMNNNSLH